MATESIPTGALSLEAEWGNFNQQTFVIQQLLNRLQTATLVQIVSVTNNGGVSPVGLVDVLPLVNQVDSNGAATPHGVIHNVPYMRMQGGANAIILDPVAGDIGIACFASRDISKVKNTKAQGNPGSFRKYDWGDALYVGGMLNAAPTQYVQFSPAGIKLHSPTAIILEAPDVQINAATVEIAASASVTITTPTFTVNGATILAGPLSQTGGGTSTMSGDISTTGDVVAGGKSLKTHTHNVTAVGSPTGPPL